MKKKLEAELVSIAHRVLKLKNREETKQLHEEAKRLYEQLTILRFYEENFEAVKNEISEEEFEEKLENPIVAITENPVQEVSETVEVLQTEEIIADEESIIKDEELAHTPEPEVIEEEEIVAETESEKEEEPAKTQPQAVLFEDVFAHDYKDLDFVRVDDVPKEVEKVNDTVFEAVSIPEPAVETVPESIIETKTEVKTEVIEPKIQSLNDKLTKGINIGLNDRIAFEKKLFNGSADDFNRVLSQLNTFDSFDEAKGFIEAFVKPDYNNWEGKEEYEIRFLDIVEKKFS